VAQGTSPHPSGLGIITVLELRLRIFGVLRHVRAGYRVAAQILAARRQIGWHGLAVRAARRISGAKHVATQPPPSPLIAASTPARGAHFDAIYAIGFWPGEPKRYRVLNMAEGLSAAGYAVQMLPFDNIAAIIRNRWTARVLILFRAEYDRRAHSAEVLRYARTCGMRLCYDIDDLVFDPAMGDRIDELRHAPPAVRRAAITAMAARQRLLLACDCVTASTAPLARAAAALERPSFVVPNALNSEQIELAASLGAARPPCDNGALIGYFSGSPTHQRDFAVCEPALLEIMHRYPALRFRLGGYLDLGRQWDRYRDRIERIDYLQPFDLLRAMAETDINLAPLEVGNPFCEAKSELKFFEAAIVGVPTIASATEPYAAAIEDGVSGLLAADQAAWLPALDLLVASAGRRRQIGDAARQRALQRFSPAAVIPQAVAALGL
jgi:glycosyltransferase involved in cell wall biosynthesis